MHFPTTTTALLALALPLLTHSLAILLPRQNAQSFSGALGGVAATPVLSSGDATRPFSVKGDTFVNVSAALQRSCDQQFNGCANLANGGGADFSIEECQAQKGEFSICFSGGGLFECLGLRGGV